MPEPKQLTFLEKLAADKSDTHAIALAKARQALRMADEQLVQLQRYEKSYNDQLGERLENALSIDALRGHHRFMQNIANAVRQQDLEVARRRAYADAMERVWQESERRRQGCRVLAGKAAEVERRADERREQKTNDEISARKLLQSNLGF